MAEAADIRIVPASPGDGEELIAIQRRAFGPAAERYGIPDLPPLLETVDQVEIEIARDVVLKAIDEHGRAIGAVRGQDRSGCVYVGRLVVDPAFQRRGIAKRLMLALEERFPAATCFELFTGSMNEPGMGLYLQLGYREVRRERKTETLSLVYLDKPGPSRASGAPDCTGEPRS